MEYPLFQNSSNVTEIAYGSSLYNFELSLQTLNNFGTSDYVNPDFNLFNSFFIVDGISVFSFSDPDEAAKGASVFSDVTFSNIAKGRFSCYRIR